MFPYIFVALRSRYDKPNTMRLHLFSRSYIQTEPCQNLNENDTVAYRLRLCPSSIIATLLTSQEDPAQNLSDFTTTTTDDDDDQRLPHNLSIRASVSSSAAEAVATAARR